MIKKTKTVIFLIGAVAGMFLIFSHAEAEYARVFSVDGNVSVIPKDSKISNVVTEGMVLKEGDWIKTAAGASVKIAFDAKNENVIDVKENTLIIIKLDGYFKMHLLAGEIFAFLENVEKDQTFRVLMPSVVTESENSGWGASSDGNFTNVMVFDNRAILCGVRIDGSVDDKQFWIEEGFQRKTIKFQDPGEMRPVPEEVSTWFKEQVVSHHLQRSIKRDLQSRERRQKSAEQEEAYHRDPEAAQEGTELPYTPKPGAFIVDGEEINLVEFLYRERLRQASGS